MPRADQSTHLQRALLAPAARLWEEVLGWISLSIAIALAVFDIFLVVALVRASGTLSLWILLSASALLTCIFMVVGYRLVRDRSTPAGSLLNSASWFACFALFAIFTLFFLVAAVTGGDLVFAQCAALPALLTLLAFGAATHFRRRR